MSGPGSLCLPVTEIQRHCMHDGPGLRTVVFLKGCPLRCAWCHNPETHRVEQELFFYPDKCIGCGACVSACPVGAHTLYPERVLNRSLCVACGRCAAVCCTEALTLARRDMTVDEILAVVLRDRAFYTPTRGGDAGGLTVSGGEPMFHPEGALALLSAARATGISTAVETCGYFPPDHLSALAAVTDLLLWDVKDTCDDRHRRYTGVSNRLILDNLRAADALGARIRLRCILVNGINTEPAHYRAIDELAASLSHCEGIDFIPYHAYAGSKARALGLPDNTRADWIPKGGAGRE